MDNKLQFRLLKADEIDVRIGKISEKTTTLLLYKDARVDMDILDETVGMERWQRRHYLVGDNLHCEVSVWFDGVGWVAKSDVGTESNTEKEKGEASDSFKRACVNWGIGRELYTAKNIRVGNDKIKWYDNNGKKATYDTFHVAKIDYSGRAISGIVIANQYDVVLYTPGGEKTVDKDVAKREEETTWKQELDALISEYTQKVRQLTGDGAENIQAYFQKRHGMNIYEAKPGAIKVAIKKVEADIQKAANV